MFDFDDAKDITIYFEPYIHVIEYHPVNLVRVVLVSWSWVLCQHLLQGGYIGLRPTRDGHFDTANR